MLAKVLNMLIGLKGNNYYSKVFKRVNYKLWNSTFWVVIRLQMLWTRDLDDMSYSVLWNQAFRCHEQLRVLDDMKDSRSHELKPLDAMNNSKLWIIWTTRDPMSSGLWMVWTTQGFGWYEWLCVMSLSCPTLWISQGYRFDEQLWIESWRL